MSDENKTGLLTDGEGQPLTTQTGFNRRRFLQVSGVAASLAIAPAFLRSAHGDSLHINGEIFSLGVASGDPDSHSLVLWTRLAPDPLNGGGIDKKWISVRWEVAEDMGMTRIIRQGATLATRSNGHAVRVMVGGLPANRWLYYRFHALGESSRGGRTRTFPARRELVDNLRFAVVSCQNYTDGFFPAYRDILSQNLDFVVHTGDYIYENGPVNTPIAPNRNHNSAEIFLVDDYRNRYALYRLDRDLQEAHAQLPFLVTWDDHEVDNDYAGFNAESGAPLQGEDFRIRRRNAYQVYSETMPLRFANTLRGKTETMRLFRKLSFGQLANVYMLDTRQFRSKQPSDGGFGSTSPASAALEPVLGEVLFDATGINDADATLTGRFQENWLRNNLQRSSATWNVLAQQVMVMPWNLKNTARVVTAAALQQQNLSAEQQAQILAAFDNIGDILNVDAWDGYPAARQRLFNIIRDSGVRNPVVLTGDIHSAWGAELLSDFSDPASALIAAEFVCTSIASDFAGLDPRPTDFSVRQGLADNAHIKYFNGLFRGYCVCDVNSQRWQTTYRAVGAPEAVADLSNPLALVPFEDSPVDTDAVLEIAEGFNQADSDSRLETSFSRFSNNG